MQLSQHMIPTLDSEVWLWRSYHMILTHSGFGDMAVAQLSRDTYSMATAQLSHDTYSGFGGMAVAQLSHTYSGFGGMATAQLSHDTYSLWIQRYGCGAAITLYLFWTGRHGYGAAITLSAATTSLTPTRELVCGRKPPSEFYARRMTHCSWLCALFDGIDRLY